MVQNMFEVFSIPGSNRFAQLSKDVIFEDITRGRKGAVLMDTTNGNIPIVRTTTSYSHPAQTLTANHLDLIKTIKESVNANFNNAMIEIYDETYRKMGFHTDQSLDLSENSYICVFSCYEDESNPTRVLTVQNKTTNETCNIQMENNSAIVFSLDANKHHLHRIVLGSRTPNRWLGITLRLSKFSNDMTVNTLRLANEQERKEMFKLKGRENREIDFVWPKIDYTISKSDLMSVV